MKSSVAGRDAGTAGWGADRSDGAYRSDGPESERFRSCHFSVTPPLRHSVTPPLVAGGQGRSGAEVEGAAVTLIALVLTAVFILAGVAVLGLAWARWVFAVIFYLGAVGSFLVAVSVRPGPAADLCSSVSSAASAQRSPRLRGELLDREA